MSTNRIRWMTPERLDRHQRGLAALNAIWDYPNSSPTKKRRPRPRRRIALRYGL